MGSRYTDTTSYKYLSRNFFLHQGCIIVNGNVVIGENSTICQRVAIGYSGQWPDGGGPTIGDNVILYSGAKIFGCIRLGDNVIVWCKLCCLQRCT